MGAFNIWCYYHKKFISFQSVTTDINSIINKVPKEKIMPFFYESHERKKERKKDIR